MAARASDVRIRVAAVIPYEGRIPLVRHRAGAAVYHLLPGGGVERGESVGDALAREVLEETGLVARAIRPLFVSDAIAPDGSRHMVQLTFLAEATGGALGAACSDARVEGVDLALPEDLHAYDLRPPMADVLRDAAERGWTGEARYLGPLWTEGGALAGTNGDSRP